MIKNFIHRLAHKIYIIGKHIDDKQREQAVRKKYSIHPAFRFNGQNIEFYGEGEIVCGKDSYIGSYSTVQAFKNCRVSIGENCSISHNVRMYTQSSIADYDFSKTPVPDKTGNIIIGDHVWIGANVFINPGVNIGNNSVIGANSVVTKDVEPFAIVGGIPARLIRYKKTDV